MKFLRWLTHCPSRYRGRRCCLPRWHVSQLHFDRPEHRHGDLCDQYQWTTRAAQADAPRRRYRIMDTPTCTKCGGTERPVIRYADGDVRCQHHLKVAVASPPAVK